ncbi:MAG: Na+/H+ antiporter NhaC family protein [Pseudomonadota bacterium]
MESASAVSLIPVLVVIVCAVWSKRPLESLVLGTLAGLAMLSPSAIVGNFATLMLDIMMSETIAWVIVVCGLMGSIIVLLTRSGAAEAFADSITRFASNRRRALLSTWVLGIIIFIDDYLNALAVSAAMKKVTDRFGISRAMLAYVVDSTAAPICVLIPFSTWAVFFAGVLEESGVAATGDGFSFYISAIPYMLYAWAAIVALVALGMIPALGPMKRAESRQILKVSDSPTSDTKGYNLEVKHIGGPFTFLVCLGSLVLIAAATGINVLVGVLSSLAITIALLGFQKTMPWHELFDCVTDGIKLMVPALSIVVVAFMFQNVSDQLGLPDYVIGMAEPIMSPTLLPLMTFITMGLIAFATGSFWGILAIAVPIVVPLAQGLEVSVPLVLGALLSASAFGSHACFYSDSTVLAAQGSGCGVVEHALTQLPYVAIAALVAGLLLTLLA